MPPVASKGDTVPDNNEYSASGLYKDGNFVFDQFFTQSAKMADCLRLARHAAKCDLAVMIVGESGTGKNLLAQAIHNASPRKDEAFVCVNMSSLSDTLIQSELFGHERGAFTGADKQHKGKFEAANGGTLVMDEIGDMSISAQPKILHAVEYQHFHRVGGEQIIESDARLISLTNRNVDELVESGRFRLDLLYRLREIEICIPPLRERIEDIPLIAEWFRAQYAADSRRTVGKFTQAAVHCMQSHDWPGNLREMKSVVRRSIVLAMGEPIDAHHLGLSKKEPDMYTDTETPLTLEEVERRHIIKTLSLLKGNKRQVARILNISRSTLDRKIGQYEIDISDI